MPLVTIIGGHGKVALLLAKELINRSYQVRSLIRSSHQQGDVASTGAEPQLFDIETATETDFMDAAKNSDIIVWSAGAGGKGGPERTYQVDLVAAIKAINAARALNIRRFVTVSFLGTGFNHGFKPGEGLYRYAEAKSAADACLRLSGLDWTILAPGHLTDQPPSGKIVFNPPTESSTNGVSRSNVALVAAEVIAESITTVHKTIPFLDGDTPVTDVIKRL